MICSMADEKAPTPHCSSMNPICAMVDQASCVLMRGWVSITIEAKSAVPPPTMASSQREGVADTMRSEKRSTAKPPR